MEKHPTASPADLITQRIADLGDWRGPLLAWLRQLILEARGAFIGWALQASLLPTWGKV